MAYIDVVNVIRDTVKELDGDIYFQHGLRVDGSLSYNEVFPQVHLFPFTSTIDITNGFYENPQILMLFCDQDRPDTSVEEREAIIQRMDDLSRDFIIRLDNNISGRITGIRREPVYRQLAGTVSGYSIQFTLENVTNIC